MTSPTKRIQLEISLNANGVSKLARMDGYAFVDAGFLVGHIQSNSGQLSQAEKVLLTAFSFTGCPIAARTAQRALNPWLLTHGEYIGRRTLCSDAFEAESSIQARGTPAEIRMRLQVGYRGQLPPVRSIVGAFQEHICERKVGELSGEFDLVFQSEDGALVPARAKTTYELAIKNHVAPVWRNITILDSESDGVFTQVEQIDLFGDAEAALADLRAKRDVINNPPVPAV